MPISEGIAGSFSITAAMMNTGVSNYITPALKLPEMKMRIRSMVSASVVPPDKSKICNKIAVPFNSVQLYSNAFISMVSITQRCILCLNFRVNVLVFQGFQKMCFKKYISGYHLSGYISSGKFVIIYGA